MDNYEDDDDDNNTPREKIIEEDNSPKKKVHFDETSILNKNKRKLSTSEDEEIDEPFFY
jgi:hypothetical protein